MTINESSSHTYNMDSQFSVNIYLDFNGPNGFYTPYNLVYTIQTDIPDCTGAQFLSDYQSTSQQTIVHVVGDYIEVLTPLDPLV